jgi:DNA-binding response OmpR family regulator
MTIPAHAALPKRRVLFIEDEPGLLRAYQRFFAHDLVMAFAATGAAARTELTGFRPDVVVLDLHLPDDDGVEVLREVRRRTPGLPVIITTSYSSMQPVVEVLGLAHSGYLVKPFDLNELARHINDAV